MKVQSCRYGYETACKETADKSLKEKLDEAVKNLKAEIKVKKRETEILNRQGIIPAKKEIRNFTFGFVDGELYYREGDNMTCINAGKKKLDRITGLHNLRVQMRKIIDAQVNNCNNNELEKLQTELNNQYDVFIKKYGNINSSDNSNVFNNDDDYNLICSLENYDNDNKKYVKADIFTQRTIRSAVAVTHAKNLNEAYQISLDRIGRINIEYMAQLLDKEPLAVLSELKELEMVYKNPLNENNENELVGYEEASEYLSGNIREKLATARLFAVDNPDYERNVQALEKVLPTLIEVQEISVRGTKLFLFIFDGVNVVDNFVFKLIFNSRNIDVV